AGWSGCSRPSSIWGNRVRSATSRTGSPAAPSAGAVPPVDTSSTPRAASPRASSTIPVLSATDRRARRTSTTGLTTRLRAPVGRDARGSWPAPDADAAPFHGEPTLGIETDRVREEPVFLDEDASGQGLLRVPLQDRHRRLEDDRPGVRSLVDQVDGRSRHLDAMGEGLPLGVEAGERGQERGVNVEDPAGKGGHELRGQEPHVPRPGAAPVPRPRPGEAAADSPLGRAYVYVTRRGPRRMTPISRVGTSAASSRRRAPAARAGGTTQTKPIPMLNTRNISASAIPPTSRRQSKTGGTGQAPRRTTASSPGGRTRGRFPVSPPPVTWAIA